MRVLSVSFSSVEITGGTLVKKNAYIDVSASGGIVNGVQQIDTIRKYPQAMAVYNSTGGDVEIALLANETEEADFAITPANYFFFLPNNGSIGVNAKVGRVYKVCVRSVGNGVTKALRIDFLQHVGTLKIN
jgi:hypothetical protein